MLACNALSSGTGFSREGGISDSKHGVDVLASSRLKPVPQGVPIHLLGNDHQAVINLRGWYHARLFPTGTKSADRFGSLCFAV